MPAGPFAGDAAFVLEEAVVNGRRIEAPAGGEKGHLFDVGIDAILHAEGEWLCRIRVFETSETELLFGSGRFTLVPKGPTSPCVSAENAAVIGLNPGMMMQHRAGIEKLDASEFATHFEQKTETGIDVIIRFRQAGAKDDNPPFHGWRDEEPFVAGQSFNPRTGFGVVKTQSRLNGLDIAALNRQPGRRANPPGVAVRRNIVRTINRFERMRRESDRKGPWFCASRQERRHANPAAQGKSKHQQQQDRKDVDVHSGANLRAR
jgi:hypothetical protein